MTVRINGVEISDAAVYAEMQYHPAPTAAEAQHQAAEALALRELLLQEARRRGLGEGAEAIDALLAAEVPVVEPGEAEVRAYFEAHRDRFRSTDLVEAEHILIAAPPDDEEARAEARRKAERLLEQIQADPARFAALAREHSDCPSKANDGNLGQITRGATVPEFETFLFSLDEGELCPVPVPSRYGVHIIRMRHRAKGEALPFEHVRGTILDYLAERAWRRDLGRFIAGLVEQADIEGVDLAGAATSVN